MRQPRYPEIDHDKIAPQRFVCNELARCQFHVKPPGKPGDRFLGRRPCSTHGVTRSKIVELGHCGHPSQFSTGGPRLPTIVVAAGLYGIRYAPGIRLPRVAKAAPLSSASCVKCPSVMRFEELAQRGKRSTRWSSETNINFSLLDAFNSTNNATASEKANL